MNTFYNVSILLYTFLKNFDRWALYKGVAKTECYIENHINSFFIYVVKNL